MTLHPSPTPLPARNAAVDTYIAKAAPFAQPILTQVREIVHAAVPGAEEAMKWSRPFFLHRGIILGNLAAFKAHCSFGLWGAETAKLLRGEGVVADGAMGSFGRLTSLDDLPPRKDLLRYIAEAARLIEEGVRTKSLDARPPVVKKVQEVPPALLTALEADGRAAERFAAMSPGCRREYSVWISEAKREETRARRIREAVLRIAEGKSRDWKYEGSR